MNKYNKIKKENFIEKFNFPVLPKIQIDTVGKTVASLERKIAFEEVEVVDEEILKQLFNIYKGSGVSDLYVIDKKEFKKFLIKYIPIYLKEKEDL